MARRSASDSASQTSHGVPLRRKFIHTGFDGFDAFPDGFQRNQPAFARRLRVHEPMRFASVMGVSGWLRMEVSCSSLSPTKR